ncbi:MAG: Protein RecA, partial [Microgenomates bacterium 39_7]
LKFYASQRLDIRRIGAIKEGDEVVGSRHRVKVTKNKVAPPFKKTEFDMNDRGISWSGDILDLAVEMDIVERSGSFYKYKGEVMAQGREASKEFLEQNEKIAKEIRDAIWAKVKEAKK